MTRRRRLSDVGAVWAAAAAAVMALAGVCANAPVAGAWGGSGAGAGAGRPSSALAQTGSRPGSIDFVAQTPWVGTDGQFRMSFTIVRPTGPSNLEVVVSVHAAVAFRSEFQETLANRLFGDPVLPDAVFPLGGLTPDLDGNYAVAVSAALGSQDGVYPVRVALRQRDDFEILDEFVTHLVYLPGEHIGTKLGVSIVLPIHRPPALQPDGTRLPADENQLATLSAAVDAARALPVSFVPTPETMTALVASRNPRAGAVLTSLRAVDDRSIVGGTYVPVSLPALTTGSVDEAVLQLERGTATLTEVLRVPDAVSRVWVAEEPLDAASIDLLAGRGVDRVVATEPGLAPIPDQLITLTGPFELVGERTSVHGAAADPGLTAHFSEANPALQAAHLLADLAVLYLDLPGEERGVVALAPRLWQPSATFFATLAAGLTGHPVVEAMAIDTLFTRIPDATDLGEPLVRRPAVDPGGSLTGVVGRIRGVRGRLDALGSVLGPTNAVSGDLDERLLVAQSADFRSPRERDPFLTGVQSAIDEQLGGIVMPQNRSITLTAREGEIPVTFQNNTGHPVKVVVRMESDKLDFPQGERIELDLTRVNTTHRFPVVARTSGAFPIRITLESPDGNLLVGRARLTVRSTAASGVGLGISVGAALFLALWWGRHAQRGRRARRLMEPGPVPSAPLSIPTAPPAAPPAAPPVAPPVAPVLAPVRTAAPGATVLAVPPLPVSAPGAPTGNGNDDPRRDVNEVPPPVPAPGTLGGG